MTPPACTSFSESLEFSTCIPSEGITFRNRQPKSIFFSEGGWQCALWDVTAGSEFSTSLEFALPTTGVPFWCIPGLFWGDNQQDGTGEYYPRFLASATKPGRFESSFWEFEVWRAAQPLVAAHDGSGWWVLEVEPHVDEMVASVGFAYRDEAPVLIASLPARERPYRNVGHDYTHPIEGVSASSEERTIRWRWRCFRLEGGKSILLEYLRERYHAEGALRETDSVHPRDYADATRDALLKWHYKPDAGYFRYTVAFDRVGQQLAEAQDASLDRHEMALGWVSGWVVFQALLEYAVACSDEPSMVAVQQSWKKVQEAGLTSPSGFWWTRFIPQPDGPGKMDGNWMKSPRHLHMRTLGDAVWRAAKSLRKFRTVLPFAKELEEQVLSQARFVEALAREGWPLPLAVDAHSGKATGLKGTAGMIWLSVWSELHQAGFAMDHSLLESGLDFYREAVATGQLFGAPEDVGECVSSEDIYIAVNAYLDGYRVTGRDEDLATACQAAEWIYLWRKSFNHRFDPRTLIGVYDLKSRGGDLASFKNNHIHLYGLDVEESLRTLSQLTGNPHWKDLADDHWAFAKQLTPLVDGQFNAYRGMVTEQFYFIDWSALGNSVYLIEEDGRRADYDVGPHCRNHGNLAGFSHAWCTAFVLRNALART